MNYTLVTFEIVLVVIAPLLFLYLKSSWPLRVIIPCLLSIPLLWYLTYSPLHELSHVVGTYLVGGKVTYIKIIPRFWLGEFGHAWITPEGLTKPWQQLTMTSFPYLFDDLCLALGIFVLQRRLSKNAFVIGFMYMLLCLRPTFDFLCESIAFLSGNRGDFYHIDMMVGSFITWSFLLISIAVAIFSIVIVLKRFIGFPEALSLRDKLNSHAS
jgi:hypothetical protein